MTDANSRAQKLGLDRAGRSAPKSGVDSCFVLERVGPEAESIVQEVFNSAPRYHFNTEGVEQVPGAARSALTALPPDVKVDQKFTFLLRVGERVVGFADLIRGYPDAETAYLGLLLIREPEQQKGWGREFYRKLEALAAHEWGCRALRLSIVDSNPVQSFWDKLGFEMTEFTKPHAGLRLESTKRVMVKRIT